MCHSEWVHFVMPTKWAHRTSFMPIASYNQLFWKQKQPRGIYDFTKIFILGCTDMFRHVVAEDFCCKSKHESLKYWWFWWTTLFCILGRAQKGLQTGWELWEIWCCQKVVNILKVVLFPKSSALCCLLEEQLLLPTQAQQERTTDHQGKPQNTRKIKGKWSQSLVFIGKL